MGKKIHYLRTTRNWIWEIIMTAGISGRRPGNRVKDQEQMKEKKNLDKISKYHRSINQKHEIIF